MIIQLNKIAKEPLTFREKAKSFLTGHFFILEVILISTFLMVWIGGPGYLAGLGAVLITFWATRWDWSYFGLGNVKWAGSIFPALGFVMLIILFNDVLIEPLVELLTDEGVNLESFEGLRGNLPNLLLMLAVMWVTAAFGEEFFFRGYLMNRLAHMLGNKNISWIIAIILSSIVFGIVHGYQGTSGMITTGTVGLILGFAFYQNRDNLIVGILAHGIYDTYGLTLIYFGNELVIKNMMTEIFQSFIH
ncbi:CPBP family intramembrane glutamic endopeptidase [Bacteroidota bacterium]